MLVFYSEVGTLHKESNSQTHMLMQVVEVHRRKRVVSRMEIWCRVHHVLVADVGSRVACIIGSTVITAGITALVGDHWQSSVHRYQLHNEVAQRCAHVICINSYVSIGGKGRHVLIDDRENLDAAFDVVLHHRTSAQETTFLTRVEVELQGVLGSVLGCCKNA
jgi:hypothetical protein